MPGLGRGSRGAMRLMAAAALLFMAAGPPSSRRGWTAPLADAAPRSPATDPASRPVSTPVGRAPFTCSLVLGVAVTAEWFGAGFERVVDDARWEAITRPHTALADWADPANPAWALPPVSPCAARAADPDRVIFTAMDWDYTRGEQWIAALSAVVKVIEDRFPHVRRIELLTMVRAPGNRSCGNSMSVVAPFIDQAIAEVTGRYPKLVQSGPQFEVPRCDLFRKGGPHFTDEGSAVVASVIGAHYSLEGRERSRRPSEDPR